MMAAPQLTVSWRTLALATVALLAIGAGATLLILTRPSHTRVGAGSNQDTARSTDTPGTGGGTVAPVSGVATPAGTSSGSTRLSDVTLLLTPEAIARAGIMTATVTGGDGVAHVRIPAIVEANAYRRVSVTPIVGGRVTSVAVALGDRVRRGQSLAQMFSPELAEAQTQFVSLSAQLEVAHQQLRRTEQLVEIGSASRQELENIRAEHAAHAAHVEGARAKLALLGMTTEQVTRLSSASGINATTQVPTPMDGVVTERDANVGLNVGPGTKLFTVVELSSVWIVGSLYEKDFAIVRVGSSATMTTPAYPDLKIQGTVSYIDPQVNPATRAAQVRVDILNPKGQLRLGMYADLEVETRSGIRTAILPKTAVQNVSDRQVVYLVDARERGRFIEREVRLGSVTGDQVEVTAGVQPGDVVVTNGSFSLRAERERLGLRKNASGTSVSGSRRSE